MGRDVFYITTPIYYPNDVPHIGHAYDAVATDCVARHHRLRGEEVFHLTGTDEHGLKLQRAAEAAGKDPRTWVDEMEPRWREGWARLGLSHADYIRLAPGTPATSATCGATPSPTTSRRPGTEATRTGSRTCGLRTST